MKNKRCNGHFCVGKQRAYTEFDPNMDNPPELLEKFCKKCTAWGHKKNSEIGEWTPELGPSDRRLTDGTVERICTYSHKWSPLDEDHFRKKQDGRFNGVSIEGSKQQRVTTDKKKRQESKTEEKPKMDPEPKPEPDPKPKREKIKGIWVEDGNPDPRPVDEQISGALDKPQPKMDPELVAMNDVVQYFEGVSEVDIERFIDYLARRYFPNHSWVSKADPEEPEEEA